MEPRAARREPPNADYEALFELSAAPTVEVDAVGVIQRVNPSASRLLDAAPEDVEGTALDVLLDVDLTEALATAGRATVTARTADGPAPVVVRSVRRSLRGADGDRVMVQLTPVPAPGGQPGDARPEPARWAAIEDISHNLGTPLAIVAGYAETLASRIEDMDPDAIATAAAAIHRHAARAVDELQAVQARVRFDTGGVGTIPTSVLLAWLRRMLDASLVAANAALVGSQQVDVVTVDVAVARQALLNACAVALDADPPPRVLELSVRSVDAGTEFLLRTEGTTTGVGSSSGAPLTIEVTRSLVEGHGGTYEAPTAGSPDQRIVLPTTTRDRSGQSPAIRVAIIEDQPDTAALVRASLRSSAAPFEVVADERTLETGLAAVATSQPHIVLLDQDLPDSTGTGGIAELRALAPGTRVVILSARGPRDDEVDDETVWLEKGRVLADLGPELIRVLAADGRPRA